MNPSPFLFKVGQRIKIVKSSAAGKRGFVAARFKVKPHKNLIGLNDWSYQNNYLIILDVPYFHPIAKDHVRGIHHTEEGLESV